MFLLWAVGLLALVYGLAALLGNRKNQVRRKRILATKLTPVARAGSSGPVEVAGLAVAGDEGLVTAPLSKRNVVWWRVTVTELVPLAPGSKNGKWQVVFNEEEGRPFWIDDGSGQRARVLPKHAQVDVKIAGRGDTALSGVSEEDVYTFLESRDFQSTHLRAGGVYADGASSGQTMRFTEEVLQADEPVYAIGPSRREAADPGADGYRGATTAVLTMSASPGPIGGPTELILSNGDKQQLLDSLQRRSTLGFVGIGIGLVLLLVASFEMIRLFP